MESRFQDYETKINAVIQMMQNSKKYQDFCNQKISELDRIKNDLDHKLELDNLNAAEIMKVASQMRQVERERRIYKNDLLIVQGLNSEQDFQDVCKRLKEAKHILGDYMDRIQEHKYIPRSDVVSFNNNSIVRSGAGLPKTYKSVGGKKKTISKSQAKLEAVFEMIQK